MKGLRLLLSVIVATCATNPLLAFSWKPWCGGVTASGAVIKGKIPAGRVRLVLSPVADLSEARQEFTPVRNHDGPAKFEPTGLQPDTEYFYALTASGELSEGPPARFRTFPIVAKSFSFAFASCSRSGSNHPVFQTIRSKKPLFFLHIGDLHYNNIRSEDAAPFRAAYDQVLQSPGHGGLMRETPLIYMWDDHDFGPNDSDRTAPGQKVARLTYQEYVPHFPLPAGSGDVPVYQAFSVGRVLFILTDLRSERDPSRRRDYANKTMMGALQLQWFKEQLLRGKAEAALIFWISTVPWIGKPAEGDAWYAYTHERREIANFVKENNVKNLCILAGDAHMLAADRGENADYASGGGAPIPVLHGSPLDHNSSYKGGPYSKGFYRAEKGEGCFGWVEVVDEGQDVVVRFSGRNHRDETRVSHTFTAPALRHDPVKPGQ